MPWLVVLALLLPAAVLIRWLRRRRLRPAAVPPDGTVEGQDDPRRRLIALSAAVRAALAARFGPAWGSRTTEEVAADPELAELVGEAQAGPLIQFLGDADRAKFADVEPSEDWAPWVSAFLASLDPGRRPGRESHRPAAFAPHASESG